jgi:shikimate kinase
MGAGKSSVARALGRRLGWPAADVDELIERRERLTVADVFARKGEAYFRATERAALVSQLHSRQIVVATGGGTFVDPQNRALINQDGLSVWLDVPLERLIARVPADGRRPLAADRNEFERLFVARRLAYEQAHVRIDASRDSVAGLVERIMQVVEA